MNQSNLGEETAPAPGGLSHVCWLGGSPCSGKSSIGQFLAAEYGLYLYSVDAAFPGQSQDLDPVRYPALTHWAELSWNARWMRPPDVLLQEALDCYREHLSLVLTDLLAVPRAGPLLVEGCALLPAEVAAWAPAPQRGLWLIPTPEFQSVHYVQRDWVRAILDECADPEAAFRNWMERDARFAEWVAGEARRCGYAAWVVDGKRSLLETACQVGSYFGLSRSHGRGDRGALG